MGHIPNATFRTVCVGFGVRVVLRAELEIEYPSRSDQGPLFGFGTGCRGENVVFGNGTLQIGIVHAMNGRIQQSGPIQLSENCHDSSGPVDIFNVEVRVGRHLADHRNPAGEHVNIFHGEIDSGLLCNG